MAHAAYKVTIKKSGDSTAFTAEATTGTGVGPYQITTAAKRILDRAVTPTFKLDGVAIEASDIASIDYLQGKVTFKTSKTGAVTADGSYMPMTVVGGAKGYKLSLTSKLVDDTDFASAQASDTRSRSAGLKGVALELSRFDDLEGELKALLDAGTAVVVEIGQAAGTIIRRGWFKLLKDDQSGGVEDLETESLSFKLAGDAKASFSLGR
jgi:hypothetical protein